MMRVEGIGELVFDGGWQQQRVVFFFGRECPVTIVFAGDEGEPIDPLQLFSFQSFWGKCEQLLNQAEHAIHENYLSTRKEIIERVGPLQKDQYAPDITRTADMSKLVTLKEIFIPDAFRSERRVIGLLADCIWDPELGLAVRIENETIASVGPQDIVL